MISVLSMKVYSPRVAPVPSLATYIVTHREVGMAEVNINGICHSADDLCGHIIEISG